MQAGTTAAGVSQLGWRLVWLGSARERRETCGPGKERLAAWSASFRFGLRAELENRGAVGAYFSSLLFFLFPVYGKAKAKIFFFVVDGKERKIL